MFESTHSWSGITFENLTQPQRDFLKTILLEPEKSYFLRGCAGSGKTVIAAHALSLLSKSTEMSVGFIVYTKLLKKFVQDGFETESIEDSIWHYHDWHRQSGNQQRDIFLIDECQDFKPEWISEITKNSSCQIWLGDDSQQIYEEADGFNYLSSQFSNLSTFALTVNFRNSLFVARFASNFIRLTDLDKKRGITLDQKVDNFIIPILNNEEQASGANNQPVVFIESTSKEKELDAVARIIKDIISNKSENSRKIAVAHFRHSTLNKLEHELRKRKIEYFRIDEGKLNLPNFKQPGLVLLTTIHSLKGLEVDYIIFPFTEDDRWGDDLIFNNLLFVLFTRARRRVYCSYSNRNQSYVYQAIKQKENEDFYQQVSADEILGSGNPIKPEEEIDEIIKNHFDNFNI